MKRTFRIATIICGLTVFAASIVHAAAPKAPTLNSVVARECNNILVTFTDNSNNETSFEIWRSVGAGSSTFVKIGTVPGNGSPIGQVLSYADFPQTTGQTYNYKVRAVNATSQSSFSAVGSVVNPSCGAPAAPSSLTVTPLTSSCTKLTVQFCDNSATEAGFTLQRALDSGFSTGLTTINLPCNCTGAVGSYVTYTDMYLTGGTTYYYRVQSYNGYGTSAWSNIASAKTTPCNQTQ